MPQRLLLPDVVFVLLGGLFYWAWLQVAVALSLPLVVMGVLGVVPVAVALRAHGGSRSADAPESDGAPPAVGPRTAGSVLIAIVLLAAAARIHTLMLRPAWADEMWTLRNIYTSDWGELFRIAFIDYWPPLHYVILNALARIGDTSLVWLRAPSAVFGIATVAMMYPLGLALFRKRIPALAGAALLAGMTSHVLYSQEARVYALQLLLAVLSAFYFYRSYWERRVSPGFVVSSALLLYAHSFSSVYFLSAELAFLAVAWVLWRDREATRKAAVSQLLVGACVAPLVAAFAQVRFARSVEVPVFWATAERQVPTLSDIVVQYQGLGIRSWAGAVFVVVMCGLALLEAWRARPGPPSEAAPGSVTPPEERAFAPVLFVLCWVVAPIVTSTLVSSFSPLRTLGATRYHMVVVPGICLLLAAGFLALRSRVTVALAASIVLLLPISELPRYYRDFNRPAIDEAAEIVRAQAEPDEAIYVGHPYRAFAYYLRGTFPRIGSAQWDSLTAAHAHLDDRSTLESTKWADTYAYERMPERIRFFGYYRGNDVARYQRLISEEVARGAFARSYWLILPTDQPSAPSFLDALHATGVPCERPEIHHVRQLEVRRCHAPDS